MIDVVQALVWYVQTIALRKQVATMSRITCQQMEERKSFQDGEGRANRKRWVVVWEGIVNHPEGSVVDVMDGRHDY